MAFSIVENGNAASSRIVENRQILDPCLGLQWQLRSDPQHPAGPAHLVLVGRGEVRQSGISVSRPPIVIRPGQLILVDQNSTILHATLQAVALESAVLGQTMKVRLSAAKGFLPGTSGATISVTATGIGTAQWLSQSADRTKP